MDVFEHTEEGEDADAETMDTAKDKESKAGWWTDNFVFNIIYLKVKS